MSTPQIPVALFIRVSDGHRQDYARQLHDLQKEVAAENYHVVATIAEQGSGSKRILAARPAISELKALVKSRQIKKVLVTEFSRLGRRGREVRSVIEDLMEAGVSTWSGRLRMETLLPDGTKNPIAVLMMFIYTER
nr:hypothetical protein [Tanacetum cinerariifolium]